MILPSRGRAPLALVLALGCSADDWTFPTPRDASVSDVSPNDAPPSDAPPSDVPSSDGSSGDATVVDGGCSTGACDAGCAPGLLRCAGACVEGPAHLYRGDGDAMDSVGADHATVHNGVGFAGSDFGDAFILNGAYAYVSIPPAVGEFRDGDFTLALWFNTGGPGDLISKRPVCSGVSFRGGFDLRRGAGGEVIIELWTSVGYVRLASPPRPLDDGVWTHVAVVRRGATLSLHVDGDVIATSAIAGSIDDPGHVPVLLGVGPCVSGAPFGNGTADGTPWFRGRIDEVAVYPRALSDEELTASARGLCAP